MSLRPGRTGLHAGRLTDAFLGRGFFHLRAHGTQVIGRRDHREEDDEHAPQCEETLERRSATAVWCRSGVMPQPKGGHRQKQPGEVEEEFHGAKNLVFQKTRIRVNVTFVW